MSPLASGRQTPSVTHASVATDLDQASNVLSDFLAKVSLDPAFILNNLADSTCLVLGKVLYLGGLIYARGFEDLPRPGSTDTVDIGQADPYLFVLWQVDSCNSCHSFSLPLTLLVFRVLANHPHHAVASDDLALRTHSLYRCTDLHRALLLYLSL
jgi:hypothetical protein